VRYSIVIILFAIGYRWFVCDAIGILWLYLRISPSNLYCTWLLVILFYIIIFILLTEHQCGCFKILKFFNWFHMSELLFLCSACFIVYVSYDIYVSYYIPFFNINMCRWKWLLRADGYACLVSIILFGLDLALAAQFLFFSMSHVVLHCCWIMRLVSSSNDFGGGVERLVMIWLGLWLL